MNISASIGRFASYPLAGTALVVFVVALTSCSSSQNQQSEQTTTAQRHASEIQLRPSDLPSGWASQPDASTAYNNDASLARCIEIANPWANVPQARVKSAVFHSFDQANESTVSATTEVETSVANAMARMNAYNDPTYPACKSQTERPALLSSLGSILDRYPGSSLGPIAVTVVPNQSIDGVHSVTVSEAYTIHGPNGVGVANITQDVIHLQKGSLITQLEVGNSYEGTGTPTFPTSLQNQLRQTLSARIGEQLVAS